jgi:hypothetical protein
MSRRGKLLFTFSNLHPIPNKHYKEIKAKEYIYFLSYFSIQAREQIQSE